MTWTIVAVFVGAGCGALARWELSLRFNPLLATLPVGTLLANLIGGYIIGLAMAFFSQWPGIPSEWRLLVITGFCGGLTTFSTFSAELLGVLQQGRLAWGVLAMVAHVAGSLLMTWLGLLSWSWWQGR